MSSGELFLVQLISYGILGLIVFGIGYAIRCFIEQDKKNAKEEKEKEEQEKKVRIEQSFFDDDNF